MDSCAGAKREVPLVRFTVDDDVFRDIPGLRLAVGWLLLERQPSDDEALTLLGPAWEAAGQGAQDPPQGHPQLAPWREVFRGLGLPARDYLPSVEALVRRARRQGPPLRVQPLVDAYNAISLRRLVPVGAFDLAGLRGDIRLGRTAGGELFWPIGAEAGAAVGAGELCYLDGDRVLTRHFVWRQSIWGMIRDTTRQLFLVSEILSAASHHMEGVLQDFRDLGALLGGEVHAIVLDRDHPASARPF